MKGKNMRRQEQGGNIMLMTAIVILILTIVVVSCIHIANVQLDVSMVERQTSNTYYLAKSGVEKQVDAINKSLAHAMPYIIQKLTDEYMVKLGTPTALNERVQAMEGQAGCKKYDLFYYDQDKLMIKTSKAGEESEEGLRENIQKYLYAFIMENFINEPPFTYEVQSDQIDTNDYKTIITVKGEVVKKVEKNAIDESRFKLIGTAQTKNTEDGTIYDSQTVIADVMLVIPEEIPHEIHEKYAWAAQPPEIVASGLISFSDVVITDGGSLIIEEGDMQVKGIARRHTYKADGRGVEYLALNDEVDARQTGGIVVSNGGELHIKNGDLACIYNVVATNGWLANTSYDLRTRILVDTGDIIAGTVGLIDDGDEETANQKGLNQEGSNLWIKVGQNVFTSNDVMISQGVRDSQIDVGGVIFGVNDGSSLEVESGKHLQQQWEVSNDSSCVFARGFNTVISAYRILVSGQPYMRLWEDARPMKLWESVGAPFTQVALWEGYSEGKDEAANGSYLAPDSPFYEEIGKNKIQIRDSNINETSYAPAKITANGEITTGAGLKNQLTAKKFFMTGFLSTDVERPSIADFTEHYGDYLPFAYIIEQDRNHANYYRNLGELKRDYAWYSRQLMYGKTYTDDKYIENYMGLRSYMTAKRSVFYGTVNDENRPQLLNFEDVIGELPNKAHAWCYSEPIQVFIADDQTISMDEFYVQIDGQGIAYPSIVVNAGNGTLTIEEGQKNNTFKGVIISKGDVKIQGEVKIEGSIIVGGAHEGSNPTNPAIRMTGQTEQGNYSPGLVVGEGSQLKIVHDPNMILKIDVSDALLMRQILDALKITKYKENTDLKQILGPYEDEKLKYSAGKVFYRTDSALEIQTQDIKVQIEHLRKERE